MLQRLAFAGRALSVGTPWMALCDAWGELVAARPETPLGRPLNRLGRGAVVGMGSLWSVARAALRREGIPQGRVQTVEGWCVFVQLMAGTHMGLAGQELAKRLLDALPGAEVSAAQPLVRQALQALARGQPRAASEVVSGLIERAPADVAEVAAPTVSQKTDAPCGGERDDVSTVRRAPRR